jgi:hypothetical protein
MIETKKHAALLAVVSILLIAKFIYIPIVDWQNTLHSEIQQQEKKLTKIDKVLKQKGKVTQANAQLEKLLTIKKSVFFPQAEETKFQLKQQKMLENLFEKSQLKLTKFAWRRTQQIVNLSASHHKLQVYFSGKTSHLMQLMSAIESYTPYIEVSDFVLNVKRQKGSLLGMVSGNLILHLYTDNRKVE